MPTPRDLVIADAVLNALTLGVAALAVYEHFSSVRRDRIDVWLGRWAQWRTVRRLGAAALGTLALLHTFAYLAPFIVIFGVLAAAIAGKVMRSDAAWQAGVQTLPVGVAYNGVVIVVMVSAYYFQVSLAGTFFAVSTLACLVYLCFLVWAVAVKAKGTAKVAAAGLVSSMLVFALVGGPAGLGVLLGAAGLETVLSPYLWLVGQTAETWADILVPDLEPASLAKSYDVSVTWLRSELPTPIQYTTPVFAFFTAADGWLLLLGVIVQLLFLLWASLATWLTTGLMVVLFFQLSIYLKQRVFPDSLKAPIPLGAFALGVLLQVGKVIVSLLKVEITP